MGPFSPRTRVCGAEALTQDEEHLHGDVADKGVPGSDGGVVIAREADVVGDGDCNVEGGEEDEAIPDGLGDAVVEEEAAGPLHGGHLVLGHRWLWLKHVLRGREVVVGDTWRQAEPRLGEGEAGNGGKGEWALQTQPRGEQKVQERVPGSGT